MNYELGIEYRGNKDDMYAPAKWHVVKADGASLPTFQTLDAARDCLMAIRQHNAEVTA